LSIYKNNINDGVLDLYKSQYSKVTIVAKDVANNLDTLEFWVHRNNQDLAAPSAKNYFKHLQYNQDNTFDFGNLNATIFAGCLYESTYINVEESASSSPLAFSPIYRIHKASTPLHKGFELRIRPQKTIPDSLYDKVCVAFREGDGDLVNCGKQIENGTFIAKVSSFGQYLIYADTVKPTIKAVHFQQNMQNEKRMAFKVSDNMGVDKYLNWRAEVDGNWILMNFDIKSKYLVHYFDERIAQGEHELKLTVKDNQGNEQEFRSKFIR
jgi:hypothetical protein